MCHEAVMKISKRKGERKLKKSKNKKDLINYN